jgi:hypothetical protein
MTYLIVAAALLPIAALVAAHLYLERQARERDRAETLRIRAMSPDERQEALILAKRFRIHARADRNHMSRLYWGFKWGHRHNPYRIRYAMAQGAYAAADARVRKLESIIAELDSNPS